MRLEVSINGHYFGRPTGTTEVSIGNPSKGNGTISHNGKLVLIASCQLRDEAGGIDGCSRISRQVIVIDMQGEVTVVIGSVVIPFPVNKLLKGHLDLVTIRLRSQCQGVVLIGIIPLVPIVCSITTGARTLGIKKMIRRTTCDFLCTVMHIYVIFGTSLCLRHTGEAHHHQQQQADFQLVEHSLFWVILLHFTT